MKRFALLALVVGAFVAAAAGKATPPLVRGPFGTGSGAVWLFVPRGRPRSVVVFLHGWKVAPPSPSYPWVGQFRPWLDHLVDRGSEIIFPAYQTGLDGTGPSRVMSLRGGLEEGFRHLRKPLPPVVVVGYSYGASLGFYYAANARRWRLPAPTVVDAVFPAGRIPGAALPALAPSTRVLIQVGDADTEAGHAGADEFWRWLGNHPASRKRYLVVHSTIHFTADHAAPKTDTSAARQAFWMPLDRLVAIAA